LYVRILVPFFCFTRVCRPFFFAGHTGSLSLWRPRSVPLFFFSRGPCPTFRHFFITLLPVLVSRYPIQSPPTGRTTFILPLIRLCHLSFFFPRFRNEILHSPFTSPLFASHFRFPGSAIFSNTSFLPRALIHSTILFPFEKNGFRGIRVLFPRVVFIGSPCPPPDFPLLPFWSFFHPPEHGASKVPGYGFV